MISIKKLPDISKWDKVNIKDINYLFMNVLN